MTKTLRIGREALLWTGGVLGALCLLALLAGRLLDVTPLVFTSGSMSPTYDAGALGIAHEVPAADIAVGDVVSVRDARGDRVTHRVLAVEHRGERSVLTLRGDANDVTDAQTYTVASADRVVAGVPHAGYVLDLAASPFGLAVTGLGVLGLLWLGFGPRPGGGDRPARSRGSRLVAPAGVATALALGGALGVSGQVPWAFTSAYWTDSASATATASRATVAPPAAPVLVAPCTTSNGSSPYNLSWTWGPGNPDSFAVVYSVNPGGTRVTTFPGTARSGATVAINNEAGNFKLVAIVNGVQSAVSNQANYQGNGGSKTCTVVP
ncbi:signal peptidase I [Pimelobacter sp. 30-1]|uniref:signal peptidase I n=1 Tax=Pimelobacter sp. 30-1 TaxID=2004991 RepID=UPI001C05683C|nr:signal peptidase I [Pimelobacter sp. 30-1]MBU2697100.1 signal peptidase I [Pimelobacter sp. 30-1]